MAYSLHYTDDDGSCDEELTSITVACENLEESEDDVATATDQLYSLSLSAGESKIGEDARKKIRDIIRTDQSVSLMFAGKTGAGKSSLINGLIGRNIAQEGASPRQVTTINALEQPYQGEYVRAEGARVKVIVWDSPGLQDGLRNDEDYLARLGEVLARVDLLVYCISMSERFDESARRALQAFARVCPGVWSHSVIALTHANRIMYPETCTSEEEEVDFFESMVREWVQDIGTLLQGCGIKRGVVNVLPMIPTGYHRVTKVTPYPWRLHARRNHWLQPFWFTCLTQCKEMAQAALILSNGHRLGCVVSAGTRKLSIDQQPLAVDREFERFIDDVDGGVVRLGGTPNVLHRLWLLLKRLLPFLRNN